MPRSFHHRTRKHPSLFLCRHHACVAQQQQQHRLTAAGIESLYRVSIVTSERRVGLGTMGEGAHEGEGEMEQPATPQSNGGQEAGVEIGARRDEDGFQARIHEKERERARQWMK